MIDTYSASLRQFVLDLTANNNRMQRAQQQVSSGLRVMQASDDPDAIADIVETRTHITVAEQSKLNLARVKTEVDTGEQALTNAIKIVEQARVAGAQGATGLLDASHRQLLTQNIESALTSLVQLTGTKVEGRYIFGGDNDQQSPYTLDLTLPAPVSAYQGAVSTRRVLDANGNAITMSRTAQQIFEGSGPGDNVFGALIQLRDGLNANDQTVILAGQANLSTALNHLNAEQSQYGKFQIDIAAAIDGASQQSVRLQTQLGSLQDADLTAAATEISRAALHQQASLAARSRISQQSLFSYLG